MEKFHRKEFGLDPSTPVPDLSIDPEDGILTIINPSNTSRAYYITVENDTPLYDRNDRLLSTGRHRLPNSTYINCTTLILTVPPNHTLDVCRIHLPPGGPQAIPIHSDISDLNLIKDSKRTKNEGKQRKAAGVSEVGFPLGGKGPFFCSQGVGGRFTHFYPATHHAIDFECPVGTPVFAIASGTVREIEDTRKAGGIHVSALYAWNSISVELEDGSLVDYVHIRTGSAKVKKGDKVTKGQHICDSGDVGFCPKPHLHLQITLSAQNNSPTTPFHFPNRLLPTAGGWYLPDGRKDHLAPKPEDWETRLEAHRVLSNATLPYSVRETICEMAGLSATASTK
ncbi:hypothetical protein AAMO2058_000383100 [Amorphochlora amoebiformis]|uniref:M23ase beta-sheet core domain-containing protein n=1 Tax=Amorphochlora amoebiformis TaxID=1561963 RepID=A0A7S0DT78_9EUKA